MQGTDYSVSDRQLTLNKAIPANSLLKIYRETTTDTIVSWNDASVLRAKDMSLQEVQLLHLAEETADKVFDTGMSTAPTNTNVWDGQYKRLTNLLDPQEDGDAVTLRYINSNKNNLINALKNEGANQNASIVATGNAQNTRLTNTGDSYVATMTTLKEDTTTKANEASNSATSASSSASTATTKATEASSSATSASSSASTATTKANEAKSSAELAKKWAMSDSSPDGVSGNKSSKTWANEAKNSATNAASSASTATTKATEASNSASAAAKSAENAKTWDPSSYYTKEQTYTKTEVLEKVYPIGSIYMNATDSRNPAEIFGFGTWVQISAGRVLLGAGTSDSSTIYKAGATGGEEKHKLTVKELPVVKGDLQFRLFNGDGNIVAGGFNKSPNGVFTYKQYEGSKWKGAIQFGPSATQNTDIISMNFGNDVPHNNMQPYLVVYIFKRTA